MKKILITGISGFVGGHLVNQLQKDGEYKIIGTSRNVKNNHLDQPSLINIDLLDANAVNNLLTSEKPDYIYHLAAMTSPAESFENPSVTVTNNILAELNILEALRKNEMHQVRMLVVTTSEMYGIVDPSDLPVDEDTPLRPISPYSVSKIAQDYLGLQYFLSHKLDIVRVRPFNHIGPGQNDSFVLPSFAKQIAAIEKGKQEPVIKVGNLEAKRDFTDVRDMVRAYQLLMEQGISGEVYNIGSNKSYQIGDLLNIFLSFSKKNITVEVDKERFRPIDILDVRADSRKFFELTGWKPEIKIEKTLEDILAYWRNIV